MSEHIIKEKEGYILKLTMNRPAKKNAITAAMYGAIADALAEANDDDQIRVVYITGTADSFTSGNDLTDFLQNPVTDENSPVSRFLYHVNHFTKPMVAAVNGLAIGVGVTMLLHCDLVYAAESAVFQMPFVNLAVVPEAGSTYIMPRMMGHQRAAELLMLCEKFGADEAHAVGIVNQVLADDALQSVAWQKAVALSQKPPESLRLTKMLLRKGETAVIAERIKEEGAIFRERLVSDESREVMMAFMEKRQPSFG